MSKILRRFPAAAIYIIMTAAIFVFSNNAKLSVLSASERCVKSLLPGIFPMMVLSKQLSYIIDFKKNKVTDAISKITGFSEQLLPVFLIGLLCGYPIPAVLCSDKYLSGQITKPQAEFAAALCNNTSPGFIFFFVGTEIFGSLSAGAAMYAAQCFSVIAAAHILKCPKSEKTPQCECECECERNKGETLAQSISKSSRSMLELSGFVIFFSLAADMATLFLTRIGASDFVCSAIPGLFEITGGISSASSLAFPVKSMLICIFTAVGGLSVFFQISSVVSEAKLSMKKFIYARLMIALFMCGLFPVFYNFLNIPSLL